MRLAKTVAIQTEVSFISLYKNQPHFGDVDVELRKLGFVPHMMAALNKRMISPMQGGTPFEAFNQLLEADLVYVRDFTKADAMDDEQLKHLAIVAHHAYRSFDLAMNCIHHLTVRGAVQADARQKYIDLLQGGKA